MQFVDKNKEIEDVRIIFLINIVKLELNIFYSKFLLFFFFLYVYDNGL